MLLLLFSVTGKTSNKYRKNELVADFIVNHISRQSEIFKDYLEKKIDQIDKRRPKGICCRLCAYGNSNERKMGVSKFVLKKVYRPRMGTSLKENKNSYLIARAIQFFVPGIPQVYYVGWMDG